MSLRVGIITVSDRSARGERPDLSGPALHSRILQAGWQVVKQAVIPDEFDPIKNLMINWCDNHMVDIILTTGGTGFSPRDITPEATQAVIQRLAPGLAEAMRQASLRITPHAMLSRCIAGIRNRTIIINLPGSPKAAIENFAVIESVLPHAVELLSEKPEAETGHHRLDKPGQEENRNG